MRCTIEPPAGVDPGVNAGMIPCTQLQDLKFGRPILPRDFPAPGQPVDELALAEIKSAILAKLRLAIGKDAGMATKHDCTRRPRWRCAIASCTRWLTAEKQSYDAGRKRVYYLSWNF